MRTLVALGVILAFTASAVAAGEGAGVFSAGGVADLQGLESASFSQPAVVVFSDLPDGLAFDFTAAYLAVDREWRDVIYAQGAGPLGGVDQSVGSDADVATFTDATGALDAAATGPHATAFLAYGPGLATTLTLPSSATLRAASAGSADPYGNVADVSATGPAWWRPDVEVPRHVATVALDVVLTLTGDFDVYIFQADYTVNG